MEVVLSIVFIVAAVSVYDFISSRNWQQVTSGVRNEIVFEKRNQHYGAYVLRRDYDRQMVFIMLGVVLSFGFLFGSYLLWKHQVVESTKVPPTDFDNKVVNIQPPTTIKPAVEKIVEKSAKIIEKSLDFRAPIVVDRFEDTKLPTADELEKAKAGTRSQGLDSGFVSGVTGIKKIPGDSTITISDPPFEIYVQEEAVFKGSVSEFIQRNLDYPEIARTDNLQGTCYLEFVVNKNGSVSDVKVLRGVASCPECDQEAIRVIKLMKDWKPGKNNGKAVRTLVQLPIRFVLE